MKPTFYSILLPVSALLIFGGAPRIHGMLKPPAPRTIVTTDINIQDFSYAAEDMIKSLLASGALDNTQIQPAMLAISRIVNNTTQQIDTDLLIKKSALPLTRAGRH